MPSKRISTSISEIGDRTTEVVQNLSDDSESTATTAAYGLRRSDQRRKPSRYVVVSPPPKTRKPRGKRRPAKASATRKPARKRTAEQQQKISEKEEPLPDWYFYSPPPMHLVHTEEKDVYSISYFDDLEPLPRMPFNPTYRYKYPQLKKTKRIWVQKRTGGLFDTESSKTNESIFKVPSQDYGRKTDINRKRKAEEMTPPYLNTEQGSVDVSAVKRHRPEFSTAEGNASIGTKNSMSTSSTDINKKRKADEIDNKTGSFTETPKLKRQRVEFHLDDSDISFVSSSSVNQSFQNQSIQSVSDVFDMSSDSEMSRIIDSVGINASFDISFNRSFNNSFSHLEELI